MIDRQKSTRMTTLASASALALCTMPAVAQAQDMSAQVAADEGIGDIVVTARRREETLQKLSLIHI